MGKIVIDRVFASLFAVFFAAAVFFFHYMDRNGRGICFDCAEDFGWPFVYLQTGGQAFGERYIWSGVILNLVLVSIVAFALSFATQFLLRRIRNNA